MVCKLILLAQLFSQCYEGNSLTWYGNIPGEWSGNSTTATWIIDNNPAQSFALKGHGVNATTLYNQKFFETPVYPPGSHKLTVTYNGDTSKTPLVLGKLVIQNGTAVPSATSTHTTPSHTPAIVGGVIGGVACLLIIFLLGLFEYRRRFRQKEMRTQVDEPAGYVPASLVTPRPYPPLSQLPAKLLGEDSRSSNFLL